MEEEQDSNHSDQDVEVIDEAENPLPEDEQINFDGEEEEEEEEEDAEPIPDNAKTTFTKHDQPVFCCDLTSSGHLAVTGGQDDLAYVWETETGRVKFECTGHQDSVVCVGFNCDGRLVATGDMQGKLKVWAVTSGRCVFEEELSELSWLQWHPAVTDVLLAGSEEGQCCMFKVDANGKAKWMTGSASAVKGSFLPDGRKAVVVYGDGSVRVWDLVNGEAVFTLPEYRDPVEMCSIGVRQDGLVACGSVAGKVKLVNSSSGKVTWQFWVNGVDPQQQQHQQQQQPQSSESDDQQSNSVEALCFAESLPLLISGCVNGLIEFWDVNAQIKRSQVKTPGGLSKLAMSKRNPFLLFAAGLDGLVRSFDIRDGSQVQEFSGHVQEILDLCVCKQSDLIVTSSEDGCAKVFAVENSN